MLAWIATTDYDVAFLGDVMELWIGLGQYSTPLTAEFLAWVSAEKSRRRVFFLEGNHEFFVVRHHRDAFFQSAENELVLNGVVLSHGDTAQGDPAHLRFRWWGKSRLAHFLLRWLPGARAIVWRLKRNFERKNALRDHRYPAESVVCWGDECFARHPKARRVILGHFHCHQEHFWPDGRQITVLPAWKDSFQVGLLNLDNLQLSIQNWRDLTGGTWDLRPET